VARYGTFLYGSGVTYGDQPVTDLDVEPFIARALDYRRIEVTWVPPTGTFSRFRLLRNQGNVPESEEDGVRLIDTSRVEDIRNVSSYLDGVQNTEAAAVALTPGGYVYYAVWLLLEDGWFPASYTYTLLAEDHSKPLNGDEDSARTPTTHERMLDLLPRTFVTESGNPLDEVDYDTDLSTFLRGFSYTLDETMTFADLIKPQRDLLNLSPELLNAKAKELGLNPENRPSTRFLRRLVRDARRLYASKGTRQGLENLAEAITGYAPHVHPSTNMLHRYTDSSFSGSTGLWEATKGASLVAADDVIPPVSPELVNRLWTGKMTTTVAGGEITYGYSNPVLLGVPVTAGEYYTVGATARANGSTNLSLTVSWYDFRGELLSENTSTFTSISTSAFTPYFTRLLAPAGATSACWKLAVSSANREVRLTRMHFQNSNDGVSGLWTNLATNPSFETGSGTVEVRRNLIGNPAAVSLTGYSQANGTLSAITDFPTFGTAVRHERSSAGTVARLTAAIGTAFLPSTQYTTVFQVRASESLSSVSVEYRHSATAAGVSVWTGTIPAGVSEVRVTGTRSATAAVAGAGPSFIWSSGSVNSTLDVTRVQTELGPTAGTYFDGGTAASGDFSYAWVGTANASQSIQNAVGVTTVSAGGANIAAWKGTTWASTGTKSLRMRPVTADNSNGFAVISPGFTIDTVYTVLAKVRLTAPLTNPNVNGRKIRIHASGGALIAESAQAPNEAGVHKLSVTFTATQTANVIRLTHFGVVGDGDLWWDDLAVIEGTYTGDYFDGNTPDGIWLGAVDASRSVLISGYREAQSIDLVLSPSKKNLLLNPSFENTVDNWDFVAASSGSVAEVNGPPGLRSGAFVLEVEGNTGLTSIQSEAFAADLRTGRFYSGSIYARSLSGEVTLKAVLEVQTSTSGGWVATEEEFVVGSAWRRLSVSAATPASGATPRVRLRVEGVLAGETLQFDAAQVEEAYRPSDYMDGTYTASGAGWRGAPHESVSYKYTNRLVRMERLKGELPSFVSLGSGYRVITESGTEFVGQA
jgi:phage tail-like protein